MIYLDTSFIAPLIISEASSEMVEKAVAKAKPGELITSQWTCVEIAGLISRKLLMGELDGAEAALVRRELQVVLDESIQTISPTSLDFDSACDYLEIPKTGLRSGDALQDRKSTRLNSSHVSESRMPSSA